MFYKKELTTQDLRMHIMNGKFRIDSYKIVIGINEIESIYFIVTGKLFKKIVLIVNSPNQIDRMDVTSKITNKKKFFAEQKKLESNFNRQIQYYQNWNDLKSIPIITEDEFILGSLKLSFNNNMFMWQNNLTSFGVSIKCSEIESVNYYIRKGVYYYDVNLCKFKFKLKGNHKEHLAFSRFEFSLQDVVSMFSWITSKIDCEES